MLKISLMCIQNSPPMHNQIKLEIRSFVMNFNSLASLSGARHGIMPPKSIITGVSPEDE